MTDAELTALADCPFPHVGAELLAGSWAARHQYWIHCPCGAMGPVCDSPEKARAAWNKRRAKVRTRDRALALPTPSPDAEEKK